MPFPVSGGRITAVFGPTNEPLDSGGFNKGVDIGVPEGTPVQAIVGGTVLSAGDSGDGWGISVKVRDAQGNIHNYGHLSGVNVQPGDTIGPGTVLGASGNTGASTGPHVSYDVLGADGQYIDPSPWIGMNVAGDNRTGHPALGLELDPNKRADMAAGTVAATTEGGGNTGGGYEDWLTRYGEVYPRWSELFDKYAAATELGNAVYFDPNRGLVAGETFDELTGQPIGTGRVLMTVEEYNEFFTLDRKVAELEDEFEGRFGAAALDDFIRRAQFEYETDPAVIDAMNAADAFGREFDIQDQAAQEANQRFQSQLDQTGLAFDTQATAGRDPARTTSERAGSPFIVATPKKLFSQDELFQQSLDRLKEQLPEVPGMPYYDTSGMPPGVSLPEARRAVTGDGGGSSSSIPTIPGTSPTTAGDYPGPGAMLGPNSRVQMGAREGGPGAQLPGRYNRAGLPTPATPGPRDRDREEGNHIGFRPNQAVTPGSFPRFGSYSRHDRPAGARPQLGGLGNRAEPMAAFGNRALGSIRRRIRGSIFGG